MLCPKLHSSLTQPLLQWCVSLEIIVFKIMLSRLAQRALLSILQSPSYPLKGKGTLILSLLHYISCVLLKLVPRPTSCLVDVPLDHWRGAEPQSEGAATSFSPWPTTAIIRGRAIIKSLLLDTPGWCRGELGYVYVWGPNFGIWLAEK